MRQLLPIAESPLCASVYNILKRHARKAKLNCTRRFMSPSFTRTDCEHLFNYLSGNFLFIEISENLEKFLSHSII